MKPDAGTVSTRKGVRLAMVVQDPVFRPDATVREIITAAAHRITKTDEDRGLEDHQPRGFRRSLPQQPARSPAAGESGWPSPQALAAKPDVLLLDEPTNHLDVEGILWLEKLVDLLAVRLGVRHARSLLPGKQLHARGGDQSRLSAGAVRARRQLQQVSRKARRISARAAARAGRAGESGGARNRVAAPRRQGPDLEIQGAHSGRDGAAGQAGRRHRAQSEGHHRWSISPPPAA